MIVAGMVKLVKFISKHDALKDWQFLKGIIIPCIQLKLFLYQM